MICNCSICTKLKFTQNFGFFHIAQLNFFVFSLYFVFTRTYDIIAQHFTEPTVALSIHPTKLIFWAQQTVVKNCAIASMAWTITTSMSLAVFDLHQTIFT